MAHSRFRWSFLSLFAPPLVAATLAAASMQCFKLHSVTCCASWSIDCTDGQSFWSCLQQSNYSCVVAAATKAGPQENGFTNFSQGELRCSCTYTRKVCGATPGACDDDSPPTSTTFCYSQNLGGASCAGQ